MIHKRYHRPKELKAATAPYDNSINTESYLLHVTVILQVFQVLWLICLESGGCVVWTKLL